MPCPKPASGDSEPDCDERGHNTTHGVTLDADQCCNLHLGQQNADAIASRVVLVPTLYYDVLALPPVISLEAPPERPTGALSSRGPPRTATTPLFLQHAALLR
ncbi:MAG: hypothetical protein R6U20_11710 [Longimonas sp.]|uniref:hypothetical protein n=1 Tax=Longimonas sp. TaxID=2039626 RepID=UPI003974CA9D